MTSSRNSSCRPVPPCWYQDYGEKRERGGPLAHQDSGIKGRNAPLSLTTLLGKQDSPLLGLSRFWSGIWGPGKLIILHCGLCESLATCWLFLKLRGGLRENLAVRFLHQESILLIVSCTIQFTIEGWAVCITCSQYPQETYMRCLLIFRFWSFIPGTSRHNLGPVGLLTSYELFVLWKWRTSTHSRGILGDKIQYPLFRAVKN